MQPRWIIFLWWITLLSFVALLDIFCVTDRHYDYCCTIFRFLIKIKSLLSTAVYETLAGCFTLISCQICDERIFSDCQPSDMTEFLCLCSWREREQNTLNSNCWWIVYCYIDTNWYCHHLRHLFQNKQIVCKMSCLLNSCCWILLETRYQKFSGHNCEMGVCLAETESRGLGPFTTTWFKMFGGCSVPKIIEIS